MAVTDGHPRCYRPRLTTPDLPRNVEHGHFRHNASMMDAKIRLMLACWVGVAECHGRARKIDLARCRAAAAPWAAGGQGASARAASRSIDARSLPGVYAWARRKRLGSVSWVQS